MSYDQPSVGVINGKHLLQPMEEIHDAYLRFARGKMFETNREHSLFEAGYTEQGSSEFWMLPEYLRHSGSIELDRFGFFDGHGAGKLWQSVERGAFAQYRLRPHIFEHNFHAVDAHNRNLYQTAEDQ